MMAGVVVYMEESFTEKIKKVIRRIPRGKVATYGQIAAYAGNPMGARQVVRILHACAAKEKLPWYRIVNIEGQIALKPGSGYEEQKSLLANEGIRLKNNKIDFSIYLWNPQNATCKTIRKKTK